MTSTNLIQLTPAGLYCQAGDFHIDPWRPVPRAIITHAHSDHARRGSERYLTTPQGRQVLQTRLGEDAHIDVQTYGQPLSINGVQLSLHPAGHILGSAQVRVEHQGQVWVVSGDYKTQADPTCESFQPVRCHTFISESTFGLPIYHWPSPQSVFDQINAWWRTNREEGRASLLFAYALGKAQRLLVGVDTSIGPIYCHGAVERVNKDYRQSGVELPETQYAGQPSKSKDFAGSLVVAPPSAQGSVWARKFGDYSSAFASGWMLVRGTRRRRSVDRGFVLSDHADWTALNETIQETQAERILVTHGTTAPMVAWLRQQGLQAEALPTQFEGEQDTTPEEDAPD